jgi:hypothetical protein
MDTVSPSEAELRRAIAAQREELVAAVGQLRREVGEAPRRALDGKLPLAMGLAGALGFLRAGGLGATLRLLARRRRR